MTLQATAETSNLETSGADAHDALNEVPTSKPVRILSIVFVAFTAAMMLAVMAVTAYDVTMRKLGIPGVPGVVEWTEVALVFIALGGLVVAEVDSLHVRSPILTDRLPPRWAHGVVCVGLLVATAIAVWATKEMLVAAQHSFEVREFRFGLAHVPIWPAKVFAPIGVGAMALALLAKLIHLMRFRPAKTAPGGRKEHSDD